MDPKTRKLFVLTFLIIAKFFSDMVFSLQGPIYPHEAQSKNASALEIGIVLGVYEVASVFFGPVMGVLVPILNLRWVVLLSTICVAASTIAFGLLDMIQSTIVFIGLGCVCRIFEALGSVGYIVAVNAFIVVGFEKSRRALILGIADGLQQASLCIGPAFGSALYQFGGFQLPFNVVGGTLIILSIMCLCTLKNSDFHLHDTKRSESVGMVELLKIVPLAVMVFTIFITATCFGFIIALLEIHMRLFSSTPIEVGLAFLLLSAVCAILSPVFCRITDKLGKYGMIVPECGIIVSFIAFLLLGPAPYFTPFQPSFVLTFVSMGLFGGAVSMVNANGLLIMLREAVLVHKKQDDSQVAIQVTTLWVLTTSCGLLWAPIVAGALYDSYGFVTATLFPIGLNFFLMIFLGLYVCWRVCCIQLEKKTTIEPNCSSRL